VFLLCQEVQGIYREESKNWRTGQGEAQETAVFQVWEEIERAGGFLRERL